MGKASQRRFQSQWMTIRPRPGQLLGWKGKGARLIAGESTSGDGSEGETVDTEARYAGETEAKTEEKPPRVVVVGGSGFVGSQVSQALLDKGAQVVAISRGGPRGKGSWEERVEWLNADVFDASSWQTPALDGATGLVFCVGGFSTSNSDMERVNGESAEIAADTALQAGIPKFVLISVHDYNLPEQALSNGYFRGKRRAEASVMERYPGTASTILRPGFIYGQRDVQIDPNAFPPFLQSTAQKASGQGLSVPLQLVGKPLEETLSWAKDLSLTRLFEGLPGSDLFLASPVSVQDVGLAAASSVLDPSLSGVLDIDAIKATASAHRKR